MAMNANGARILLQSTGRNFNGARKHFEKTRLELRRDVVLARKQGLSITEIAKTAGITRQAVYNILESDAKDES